MSDDRGEREDWSKELHGTVGRAEGLGIDVC
jgi:hypothetical protein